MYLIFYYDIIEVKKPVDLYSVASKTSDSLSTTTQTNFVVPPQEGQHGTQSPYWVAPNTSQGVYAVNKQTATTTSSSYLVSNMVSGMTGGTGVAVGTSVPNHYSTPMHMATQNANNTNNNSPYAVANRTGPNMM
jgi:hypothetical protein